MLVIRKSFGDLTYGGGTKSEGDNVGKAFSSRTAHSKHSMNVDIFIYVVCTFSYFPSCNQIHMYQEQVHGRNEIWNGREEKLQIKTKNFLGSLVATVHSGQNCPTYSLNVLRKFKGTENVDWLVHPWIKPV